MRTALYVNKITEQSTPLQEIILKNYKGVRTIDKDLKGLAPEYKENSETRSGWFYKFIEVFDETGDFFKALESVKDYHILPAPVEVPYGIGDVLRSVCDLTSGRHLKETIEILKTNGNITEEFIAIVSASPFISVFVEWVNSLETEEVINKFEKILEVGYKEETGYNIIRVKKEKYLEESNKHEFLIKKPNGKFGKVVEDKLPTYLDYSEHMPNNIKKHMSIVFTKKEFEELPFDGYRLLTLDNKVAQYESLN